jgi:hypothetical protein
LSLILCLPAAAWSAAPEAWLPARWTGGPLEVERRARANTLPADAAARDAIANWYDPATLALLEGSPVNCLLVTWSGGTDSGLERRQRALLSPYIDRVRQRRLAVLGLVYPGADAAKVAASAVEAGLDGLVLEGEFPVGFDRQVSAALAAANSAAPVIPIAREASPARRTAGPVVAVEGVSPSARNLADMGIRAAPSTEPWIESNIWLARSFRLSGAWRPVWISYEPDRGTSAEYARYVADGAMGGGRWVVALDDGLRAKLLRRDSGALATWERVGATLRYVEQHADWRGFAPYGRLGLIVDPAAADPEVQDEYLKLVARRQVPYRMILRPELERTPLTSFRALLATALAPPTDAERKLLRGFAESGGVVVAGPSWGDAPNDRPFIEAALAKGRAVVYRDPDPETVARDMKELSLEESGMIAFNVPSVLTYASASGDGRRVLIQMLNYSNSPATSITIRVQGTFRTARLFQPDAPESGAAIRASGGKTDVAIPKLSFWGGLLLE